jgi:hypothetical protein
LVGITTAQGIDPNLGGWNETKLTYNLVRSGKTTPIVARIRQCSLVSVFTFDLETGDVTLTTERALDINSVRKVFPSFLIETLDENDERGYFTVEGEVEFFYMF